LTFAADRLTKPEIREWPLQSKQLRPDLVRLQASNPQRYPGLFLGSGDSGWDVLFAFPRDIVQPTAADGLRGLQAHPAMQLHPLRSAQSDHGLPFTGGWLCAFAYELGGLFEPASGWPMMPISPLPG
jgi:anthranilate synthase component 1